MAKKWLMSPQTAEKVHYTLHHKTKSVCTNCIKYILYRHSIQSYSVLLKRGQFLQGNALNNHFILISFKGHVDVDKRDFNYG